MNRWCWMMIWVAFNLSVAAEDGYRLWLRYEYKNDSVVREYYASYFKNVYLEINSPLSQSIRDELNIALHDMLGQSPQFAVTPAITHTLIIATPADLPILKQLFSKDLSQIDDEGYIVSNINYKGKRQLVVTSPTPRGLLYGTFHLLRMIALNDPIEKIHIISSPKIRYRVINHWDNPDGSIERGYAGQSLWYGQANLDSSRIKDYARANASLGINTVVINNVNASPAMLADTSLLFAARLARILRSYGIRIMLSINFSSPKYLGNLPDSDPLNPQVNAWWKTKIDEIYRLIPDFAGFLVKANSEGLPGPQDYGRTHADGANMLARLLKPYGGIVVWRAFVYSPSQDDRAKQGYNEFYPLDGQFLDNVVIQIKNGPIDFQPREPFHPLFGSLQKTNTGLEFQITQEYLGFSTHLVYLAPLYKEVLESDTYAKGKGSTVGRIIDGNLFGQKLTLIAGVANTGSTRNWCGHHFAQANWYAFGRLAWDHTLTSKTIAEEWIKLTFSGHDSAVKKISAIMLMSHEAAVNYMTPLGLHHLMGYNHHYGPQPWLDTAARPDWNSIYYHRADSIGIGFDRTTKGSNAVSQYFTPLNQIFDNISTCPLQFLLWFHHVPWNYQLPTGRTLWNELCFKYDEGVKSVYTMISLWNEVAPYIDTTRFNAVKQRLDRQANDARIWKEACLLYFQTFSHLPFPAEIEPITHTLEYYKQMKIIPPYE